MNTSINKFYITLIAFTFSMLIVDVFLKDTQGYVFGVTLTVLFISFFIKFYKVSNELSIYFKTYQFELYIKYAGRKYMLKDLRSIEFYRISQEDLLKVPIELREKIKKTKKQLLLFVILIFSFILIFMVNRRLLNHSIQQNTATNSTPPTR